MTILPRRAAARPRAALLVLAAGAMYYWRRAKRGEEKAQSDTAQMMVEQPEASVPREPAASDRNEPDAAAGGSGDEEAATTVGSASSTAAMRIEDVRLELGRALGAARHDMSRAVERAEASKPRPGRRHRAASPTTSAPPAPAPSPPPPVDKFENATYHWQNAAGAQCGPSSWAEYTTAHAEGDTHSGCLVFAAGVTDAWRVSRPRRAGPRTTHQTPFKASARHHRRCPVVARLRGLGPRGTSTRRPPRRIRAADTANFPIIQNTHEIP